MYHYFIKEVGNSEHYMNIPMELFLKIVFRCWSACFKNSFHYHGVKWQNDCFFVDIDRQSEFMPFTPAKFRHSTRNCIRDLRAHNLDPYFYDKDDYWDQFDKGVIRDKLVIKCFERWLSLCMLDTACDIKYTIILSKIIWSLTAGEDKWYVLQNGVNLLTYKLQTFSVRLAGSNKEKVRD